MIFEGTITYVEKDNNGNEKQLKEAYIFDNVDLFGEVENNLFECFANLPNFEVLSIKKSKVKEIMNKRDSLEERIFVADIASTFLDEVTGVEKVTVNKMAFFALNYDVAYKKLVEYMKQGYSGLEVVALKKTNFVDLL